MIRSPAFPSSDHANNRMESPDSPEGIHVCTRHPDVGYGVCVSVYKDKGRIFSSLTGYEGSEDDGCGLWLCPWGDRHDH